MNPRDEVVEMLQRMRFQRTLNTSHFPPSDPGICRWCGAKCASRRGRWCSKACLEEFNIRHFTGFARRRVFERANGRCEECGIAVLEIQHLLKECWRLRKDPPWTDWKERRKDERLFFAQWGPWDRGLSMTLWDMDHIVPVVEGGGCCGLDNLQTLCVSCHKADTASLAAKRAMERNPQMTLEGVA